MSCSERIYAGKENIDYIICRECGKRREIIETRHLMSDKCTGVLKNVAEYKERYPDAPIMSLKTHQKHSQSAIEANKRRQEREPEKYWEERSKAGKTAQAKHPNIRKNLVEVDKIKRLENPKAYKEWRLKAWEGKPSDLEFRMMGVIQYYQLPFMYVGDKRIKIGTKNPDFIHWTDCKCLEIADRGQKEWRKDKTGYTWEQYESERKEYFSSIGWKCLVIWREELDNSPILIERIKDFLEVKE